MSSSKRIPAFVPNDLEWRSIRDVGHVLGYSYDDPKTFKRWCKAMGVPVIPMSPQQHVVHLPSVQSAIDLMNKAKRNEPLTLEEAERLMHAYTGKDKTAEELNVSQAVLRSWVNNQIELTPIKNASKA